MLYHINVTLFDRFLITNKVLFYIGVMCMVSKEIINKKYIIDYITEYITNTLICSDIVEYNDIISYIQTNDKFKQFLGKKKNIIVYLNNFIKYNRQLLNKLLSANIVRNNSGFIQSQQLANVVVAPLHNSITIDNMEIFNGFSCPYITTIKYMGSTNKLSTKLSITNERVINYNFYNDEQFCNMHNMFYVPHIIVTNDNTTTAYLNDIYIAKLTTLDNYINIEFATDIKSMLSKCKSKYPFSHFEFFYIATFMYILFRSNNADMSKYCFIKIFDIISNKITSKYFIESSTININITSVVFNMFFKEKINTIVMDDYLLIKEMYTNYTNDTTLQEFIISCYKLIVYFKNKINRELKNIALELYDSNRVVSINKFININDTINNNSDTTYADIITAEIDNIFYV